VDERYLADESFPGGGVRSLRSLGFDVLYIAELAPGIADVDVAAEAERRDAVLLTFDRDFGELTFRHRVAVPGVVLFRLGQQPPWVVTAFLETFFASGRTLRGNFTVASIGHVRQRPILRLIDDDDAPG
jgi:predicted nuclease of predicted toxin-antitoxin system